MALNISACIIAKNEEKNLPRLLESLKGKFDEIILVDTGSTDRTVDIAKQYGCKIYHRKWQGFADARNYAVSKASGEWIWHFDADFELEEEEWRKALYYLKKVPKDINAVSILIKNVFTEGQNFGLSSNTFIHRNKPNVKWVGKVHETLDVDKNFGIPVFVKHYGYMKYETLEKKAYRNIELIKQELKELNKKSFEYYIKLFYLVQSYSVLAIKEHKYLDKVIELSEEFISNVPEKMNFFSLYIYTYLIEALIRKEEFEKAIKKVKEVKEKFPHNLDIIFIEGDIYTKLEEYDKASESFIKFITLFDRYRENPFLLSEGYAFVSDRLASILFYIENKIPKIIEKSGKYNLDRLIELWKKEKGEFLGILIIRVAINENQKIDKFINKIVNVHNKPSVLSQAIIYADYFEEKKLKEKLIRRLEKIDPKHEILLYFYGKKAFEHSNYETALKNFYLYFQKTKNINIIPKIRECLSKLGLEQELKKLDEEVNNLPKKLKTTSDNKTQQKQNRR